MMINIGRESRSKFPVKSFILSRGESLTFS